MTKELGIPDEKQQQDEMRNKKKIKNKTTKELQIWWW